MFCWDNINKQKLEVMNIAWNDHEIVTIRAKKTGSEPINDEFFKFRGKDLGHISIIERIEINPHLLKMNENKWMTRKEVDKIRKGLE